MENGVMQGIFHVHSTYSHDGESSLSELVNFCESREFSFILLTEHAQNLDPSIMETYIAECDELSNDNVTLIPGLEFGFSEYPELHLLGIGLNKYIEADDICKTIHEIHVQSGLAIIAHPSRNDYFIPENILHMLDGIEVWNAAYDSRYLPDTRSLKLFNKLKKINHSLLAFTGMDMHSIFGFREMTIQIQEKSPDKKHLVSQLSQGNYVNKAKFFKLHPGRTTGHIFHTFVTGCRILLDLSDAIYWKLQKAGKK